MSFSKIESAVKDLKVGKIIIVVDDKNRENEGDFVCSGQKISHQKINFMIQHGRGLVCAPVSEQIASQFNLFLMTNPRDSMHTRFTVSIDLKQGTSTGISADDRSKTIQALCNTSLNEQAFSKPGHVFPLIARPGGVLQRAGHTEASIDLLKLAGLKEVGVICEIIKDDGKMARLPFLKKFALKHKLKIISIEDLIQYRLSQERLVEKVITTTLPTEFGEFRAIGFRDTVMNGQYLVLAKGSPENKKNVLVRVHSGCMTGDVFFSKKCDCREQLTEAMKRIQKEGQGIILYIAQHEGRGIGLLNKLKAYSLQEQGYDTVEANQELGFKADMREYGIGAQILRELGLTSIRLLSNNPKKIIGLNAYGLKIVKQIPLTIKPNKYNANYLKTKKTKLGHLM
ncbi:MAG: 3,4-dihydroxy-2-butanone-4-phosphate synthase [Candidatus Diapherotrites archaeon]|nr:3,4-dihydroxy-2-butanone-4-phosphate synthase [Candidatus Diapherotrites archaeon]